MLAAARRPVVLTESVGRDPGAFAALVAFADALGVGVVEPTSAVCSNFPREHALHLGADPAAAGEPDLVLLVNCRAPWYPPSANPFPQASTVVIDEVPQRPHVVYQVLQAHAYLEGEVASTLDGLREEAAPRLAAGALERRRAELEAAHRRELDAIAEDERRAGASGERIAPVLLAAALREALPPDAVLVDETITHSRLLQRHLQAGQAGRWIYVQGGLGQGSGVALGVKLALGERMVVLALGDGTFLYNPIVPALMASRDLGLPLLVVIFNNRQYLSMKLNHLRFYPEGAAVANDDFDGVDLSGQPPLSEFAAPFGFSGREVAEPEELRPALEAAIAEVAAGASAVINVSLSR
ncbi:MAG TPA: thiamine pyrophosphate-dependent enzyme [Solirubrobacteraceae bacterium]|nr:thiamine pyrophosphate-dependent enzyme [Solirubrobacteraceae bacterium]